MMIVACRGPSMRLAGPGRRWFEERPRCPRCPARPRLEIAPSCSSCSIRRRRRPRFVSGVRARFASRPPLPPPAPAITSTCVAFCAGLATRLWLRVDHRRLLRPHRLLRKTQSGRPGAALPCAGWPRSARPARAHRPVGRAELYLSGRSPRPSVRGLREWTAAVAREPQCGADFFPWWNADIDAAFYRNRALARLWCDFPCAPP